MLAWAGEGGIVGGCAGCGGTGYGGVVDGVRVVCGVVVECG